MKRTLLLVLVLALAVSACSDAADEVIATVNGTDITLAEVAELYETDTLPIDSELRDAIFSVVARQILLDALMDDFGVALDDAGVELLYTELVSETEAAGMTPAERLGIPDAGLGMLRFNAQIGVIRQQAIDGIIAQPETLEVFFSDPASYTTVCARHILVATEEEALAVMDRLEGGEDFAAVAGEVSMDSPTGELPCSVASRYVTEFAAATVIAEIGALTGPVETQFGFHVIIVDERSAPTAEEVIADPLAHLSEAELNTLWGQWLNEKIQAADVTITAKYGEWTDVGIVPPEDAETE